MVITDGTNRTGGSGLRRERDLRRQGKPPTPLPIFTESERLHRIAARASTLRDRRTLRLDRLALNRLIVQLTSEVDSILHEVHGLGWSPVRWMPLVFPSPSAYAPHDPNASYVIDATAPLFALHAPPAWRDILNRIVGFAESSPMGLQACFGPPLLLALDEFLTAFSASTFKNDWLPGILRRLRLLRLPLPQPSSTQATPPLPLSTTAKPSMSLNLNLNLN